LIVVWGDSAARRESNRTPAGDHCASELCFLAGGGMRTRPGNGSTNRLGEYAKAPPVDFQEIFATVYHNLGIDPSGATINDPTGRPQHLVDKRSDQGMI